MVPYYNKIGVSKSGLQNRRTIMSKEKREIRTENLGLLIGILVFVDSKKTLMIKSRGKTDYMSIEKLIDLIKDDNNK